MPRPGGNSKCRLRGRYVPREILIVLCCFSLLALPLRSLWKRSCCCVFNTGLYALSGATSCEVGVASIPGWSSRKETSSSLFRPVQLAITVLAPRRPLCSVLQVCLLSLPTRPVKASHFCNRSSYALVMAYVCIFVSALGYFSAAGATACSECNSG